MAVSTGACAFAHTYWELLLFRSLGGIGSTMFFVSALGLMIRISPHNARGRVAGMFSSAFLVGSVAGPLMGSLTAGLGLAAPFLIYGVALLIAAAVVFISLRHSYLAAPAAADELTVTLRVALRHRAYRAALLSNFATGWSAFGLRVALVPLFITEALHRGPGIGRCGAGHLRGRQRRGGDSLGAALRPGRTAALLIIGLGASGLTTAIVGAATSLPVFLMVLSSPVRPPGCSHRRSRPRWPTSSARRAAAPPVATFQMMSDFGSIVGSLGVGEIAQHFSFEWAFGASGAILVAASIGWLLAPETRDSPPLEHTSTRPLGPEGAGELA